MCGQDSDQEQKREDRKRYLMSKTTDFDWDEEQRYWTDYTGYDDPDFESDLLAHLMYRVIPSQRSKREEEKRKERDETKE